MVDVLVTGWDGASYNHLDTIQPPFYSSLPHGGRLLPEPLYQGIPIDSGTAWTTMTTGLTVEQHGFLSINNVVKSKATLSAIKRMTGWIPWKRLRTYLYYGANKAYNLKDRTPRSHDVPYKRLWDYVDDRTLTLGVPLTYPAWRHNGVMLSGIPAPIDQPDADDCYPMSYRPYREQYNGYYYLDKQSPLEDESQPNKSEYIDQCYALNEQAIDAVDELCDNEEFRLVFAVFPLIDDLLHVMDPENDTERIEEAYRWLDQKTENLVASIDPDHTVIVSDHGMMPAEQSLNPSLYPGVTMDHDSMNGIWAGTADLGITEQCELTPALLELLGQSFSIEELSFDAPADVTTGIDI